jgi:hypothetical protein
VFNPETGLYTARFRHHSPRLGRFIQRDPAGFVDGMSLHAGYFASHGRVDPLGLVSGVRRIDRDRTNQTGRDIDRWLAPFLEWLWGNDQHDGFAQSFTDQVDRSYWQGVLDGVGIIPGVGEVADLANAGIHAAHGEYGMASLSLVAMVPVIGDAVAKSLKRVPWDQVGTALRGLKDSAADWLGGVVESAKSALRSEVDVGREWALSVKEAHAEGVEQGFRHIDKVRDVVGPALKEWIGPDAVIKQSTTSFVLLSKDGKRKFRLDLLGHGRYPPHAHMEVWDSKTEQFVDAPGTPHHMYFLGSQHLEE